MNHRIIQLIGRPLVLAITFALLFGGFAGRAAEPAKKSQIPEFKFAGNFEGLTAAQQRLIADWIERVAKLTGKKLDPAWIYDNAPISPRTTFEAVTHALTHSASTDASGKPLGSALDLVGDLRDAAQGKARGVPAGEGTQRLPMGAPAPLSV